MLDRHLLRSIVLQTLFEWDIRDDKNTPEIKDILSKNINEFAQTTQLPPFAVKMLELILEKQKDIDNIIQQAAPQWPLDKIPTLDRNVLRIGISELLFSDRNEVPPKVAINEAIELAKAFGGENSGKFVSGVLGAIYKELGEPQKYETGKNKKIDTVKLPTHSLSGVMIYARRDNKPVVMLAHNIFGYWSLLKGRIEDGLDEKESAVKKAKRKTGLDIKIKQRIGGHEYVAFNTENGHIKKKTVYFLAESAYQDLVLADIERKSKGIDEVRWFDLAEIEKLELYEDARPIIKKGLEILNEIFSNEKTSE